MKVGSKPSSTCGRRPFAVAASAVACAAACTAALAGGGSPVRPQGLLAFHADPGGDSGLYVMSADGSDVRLTSPNLAGDPFSRWSPDGTRLLFLSGAYGEGALRLLDLRAKRERTIGSDTVRAYAWSPDGRSLVYESDDATMWIAPASGAGKPRRLGRGHGPDWSPDGRWIAYFDVSGDPDVFKLPVRGGKPVRLTGRRGADFSPQWSPNGRTIAFVSERDGNTELYVVSADGLGTRRLTRDPAPDEAFQWAPDGRRLVYVSYRDGAEPTSIGIGNAEIRTVDIATGRVVQLTHNRVWDGDPAWSPDGRWLAFTRRAGYGEVGVMRADGSELRFLHGAVNAPFNDCCPSWRPARR